MIKEVNLYKTIFNNNKHITYEGELAYYSDQYHTFFPSKNKKIKFNFIGSKIQLLFATDSNGNYSNAEIIIDDRIKEKFSTTNSRSEKRMVYENTSLEFKEHSVTITGLDDKYLIFYGINIDEIGEILDYKDLLSIYLLKQNNKYYSIKEQFYDKQKKVYLPCEQNFEKNGFNDLSQLIKNITIDEETFKPINCFKGEIEILQAKEKIKR